MIYKNLASVYDKLMEDIPYEAWGDFIEEIIESKRPGCKKILDLGSGTGRISSLLSQKGYMVTNLDLSAEMLEEAKKLYAQKGLSGEFIQMDMKDLDYSSQFECLLSTFDTLNYFTDPKELENLFRAAFLALDQDGLFIFDMNTLNKFEKILGQEIYTYNTDEIVYIWENNYNSNKERIEIDISFFIKEANDSYRRFNEYHVQKYYPPQEIEALLRKAGFKEVKIYEDWQVENLDSQNIRNFFMAAKV